VRVRFSVIAAAVVVVASATPAIIVVDTAPAGASSSVPTSGGGGSVIPQAVPPPPPPAPAPVVDIFAPPPIDIFAPPAIDIFAPPAIDIFGPPPPPPPPDANDNAAWVDPIQGAVISGFGPRGGRRHEGADIKGPNGGEVVAGMSGTVIQSGAGLSGYGNSVTIDHGGGITSLYAHLSSTAIRTGAWVEAGQLIGYEGMTGRATTPHVHYEVRINGRPVNPAPYLGD
jgi:murein DD-endopeptidase MepM/ murein hydrolase activator NlpD